MANKELVLAFFANEAAADAAVATLKSWDKISDDVKLGAIGVLVADEKGQIKERKLGARSTKTGAGIGLVLAVVAPPTLLVGLVGGGTRGGRGRARHSRARGLMHGRRHRQPSEAHGDLDGATPRRGKRSRLAARSPTSPRHLRAPEREGPSGVDWSHQCRAGLDAGASLGQWGKR